MSDDQFTLEQRINILKKMVIEYDQLDDNKKISSIQEYNKILNEKEQCSQMITDYKKMLTETKLIKETKTNKKKNQQNDVTELLIKINEIKGIIENGNLGINAMILYYHELCEIKVVLDEYLKTKKMEIINI